MIKKEREREKKEEMMRLKKEKENDQKLIDFIFFINTTSI